MRKEILAATLAAVVLPATPALADHGRWGHYRGFDRDYGGEYNGDYNDAYQRDYRRTDNGIRYWQGNDGRTYCRRSNGTTGILVGGVAGALIGRSIDNRGDHAVGTILGAAGGALLGRAIDRGPSRCR